MTFNEIINEEFDPEDIKKAIELSGRARVGDVCDCHCDKCVEVSHEKPIDKADHCDACKIYVHGDDCPCDACEYNRCDLTEELIKEMKVICCYARLEELQKMDKTPGVMQEMEAIDRYITRYITGPSSLGF